MKKNHLYYLLFLLSIALISHPYCQTTDLVLPTSIKALDTPNDNADSYLLSWPVSPSDGKGVFYEILTSGNQIGSFEVMEKIPSTGNLQSGNIAYFGLSSNNKKFHYYEIPVSRDSVTKHIIPIYSKLAMIRDSTYVEMNEVLYSTPLENWFKWNKLNNLIWMLVLFGFIYYYVNKTSKNPDVYIRRIAGLEAVDEAIGRATEMGKPILYVTGSYDIDSISTIASVNILSHVAKKVAAYDSRIIIPNRFSITMTVCQEVVREAYLNIGRPDGFNIHDIFYVSDDQFAFTAAVDGIMVREKPAANFFLGTFAAEAIILAETGAMAGAIQIAGTDSTYQIPFFVVSCDYTLIGEELYAASAYLSREPKMLGSLKGQDAGKFMLIFGIFLASLLATVYILLPAEMKENFEWILFIKKVVFAVM